MKKLAVFAIVAALMLFVAVPGFAFTMETVIDPGSLTGDSDILVGTFELGGIEACCSDDVISLDLHLDWQGKAQFDWGSESDVGGMFIRTTKVSGDVSGLFNVFNINSVDISYELYSGDFYGFDLDSLNQNVSFDNGGSLDTGLNGLKVLWDFSGLDTSRFVISEILTTISEDLDGFAVGALKIDETSNYTLAVVALDPSDTDWIYGVFPNSRLLGVRNLSNLQDGVSITYTEEDEDSLFLLLLQNWSKDELIASVDVGVKENFVADDFLGLEAPADLMVTFPIFPLNVKNSERIGSGTTFGLVPSKPGDGPVYTIGELNGSFDISFGNGDKLSISLTEEENSVPTSTSSGGCSVGFLAPSALLLMLPLLFLNRK